MKKLIPQNEEEYIKGLKLSLDIALGEFRTYENLSEFTNGGAVLSTVDLEYQKDMLVQLLEQEEYINSKEEAHSVVRLICADILKEIMQPFLQKRLLENVDLINSLITELQISKDDIAGQDTSQQYDESDYILHGLKYKNIPPLILFEEFVSHYGIKLGIDGTNYLFKYYFTSEEFIDNIENEETEWYYCNNLHEMLKYLSTEFIDRVITSMTQCIDSKCYSVRIPVSQYIDKDILNKCKTPIEIYNYLDTIDIARLNLPLQHIYLLLNFNQFTIFKDIVIMNKIFKGLKERNEDGSNGYSNYVIYEILSTIQ